MFQIFEAISKMIITAYLVDYSFTLKKIKLLILVLKASSEIESFERSLHNVISGDSSSRLLCFIRNFRGTSSVNYKSGSNTRNIHMIPLSDSSTFSRSGDRQNFCRTESKTLISSIKQTRNSPLHIKLMYMYQICKL